MMLPNAVQPKKEVTLPVTRAGRSALDRLVAMVKDNKDKPFCGDFSKFERELGERLREVGRGVVRSELEKADVQAAAEPHGLFVQEKVLYTV